MLFHIVHALFMHCSLFILDVCSFTKILKVTDPLIEYYTGKTLPYMSVHEIVGNIDAQAFLFLHALSGCDTTSCFEKGKENLLQKGEAHASSF